MAADSRSGDTNFDIQPHPLAVGIAGSD